MYLAKRGEADRVITLIALIFVPIVLLFSILGIALACSEYCSLRKERRRLQRGNHKRSRSDPPWSFAATKRSDSSDGYPDLYHGAAQLREHATRCVNQKGEMAGMELGNDTITNTPKPLRISKSRREVGHRTTKPPVPNDIGPPPGSIPRRHSSYAIRSSTAATGPKRHSSILRKSRRDQRYSDPPGYNSKAFPRVMEQTDPERLPPEDEFSSRDNRHNHPAPKGGIFSRAIRALDFGNRQSSGQEPDNVIPDHGIRSSTYPKSLFLGSKKSNSDLKRYTKLKDTDKSGDDYSESPRQSGRQNSPPLPDGQLHVVKTRVKPSSRSPLHTPFAMATVKLTVDALKTQSGQDLSTWISVVVTAKINKVDPQISTDAPLDIMILVDNSAQVSPEMLRGACRNAFQVASSLDRLIDRVSVGCISSNPAQKLNILTPLCPFHLDTVRSLFRSLPAFQLQHDELSEARFSGAIKESSNFLLRHSSRGALRHIFLITASSTINIGDDGNGDELRFHTISPENSVWLNTRKTIEGWHISASFDEDEGSYVEAAFRGKLKQVVDHLRMGIDSGYLSDLSVDLGTGMGTEVEAVLGDTRRKTLRLGESWTMLVKIKAMAESRETTPENSAADNHLDETGYNKYHNQGGTTVDDMIDQLQGMLKPGASMTEFQTLLRAKLDYKHSSLPGHTVMNTEGKCEVARFPQAVTWSEGAKPPIPRCTTGANGNNTGFEKYDYDGTVKVKKHQHLKHRDGHLGVNGANENYPLPDVNTRVATPSQSPLGSMNPFKDLVWKRDDAERELSRQVFNQHNFQDSRHYPPSEDILIPIN